MEHPAIFAGIDVSKARLDVAWTDAPGTWSVANAPNGIVELVQRFHEIEPELVVMEATGGFEVPAAGALAAAGIAVVIANPRQVRDFAKSTGQLAKTDAIDTHILALFAERVRPQVRALPDEDARALNAIVGRRRQIIDMITAENNRLGFALPAVQKGIKKHIRWLERQLDDVDSDRHPRLLSALTGQRKAAQGRHGRMYEKAAHHPQRHDPRRSRVGPYRPPRSTVGVLQAGGGFDLGEETLGPYYCG